MLDIAIALLSQVPLEEHFARVLALSHYSSLPVGRRLALMLWGTVMVRRRSDTRCYRVGRVGPGRRQCCRAPARAVESSTYQVRPPT